VAFEGLPYRGTNRLALVCPGVFGSTNAYLDTRRLAVFAARRSRRLSVGWRFLGLLQKYPSRQSFAPQKSALTRALLHPICSALCTSFARARVALSQPRSFQLCPHCHQIPGIKCLDLPQVKSVV